MDDPRTDPVLKELKRIKWLLVVIAIGLLALPASLVFVGWEIVTVLLQDRTGDEPEEIIETRAEGSFQVDPRKASAGPSREEIRGTVSRP